MIIGTAGHIDHGKTALVRALTGVDTDRLREEKERGISIDLGFAYLPAPDGRVLGFVDVPGHERFVRNMLAGATGIDFVLLVVAADDGIKPQTVEHLAIVDMLGVRRGLIALTKTDLVAARRQAAAAAEIGTVLSGTALAGAEIVPVSAITGSGIDSLRAKLFEAAQSFGRRSASGRFRLAVDRCFTLAGTGTVVTGTVLSGRVAVGDRVTISPSGLEGRVRGIHAQNKQAEIGQAGDRCALNLAGRDISKDAIVRGDVVLDPALHAPADRIDATLCVLASEARPMRSWTPVRLHHAAAEVGARVVPLSAETIAPGVQSVVQLVLDRPIAAAATDRFVLRDTSGQRTIGGGVFLDLRAAPRRRRRPERLAQLDAHALADACESLSALMSRPPGFAELSIFARDRALGEGEVDRLIADTGAVRLVYDDGVLALRAETWTRLLNGLRAALEEFHAENPHQLGIGIERLRLLLEPRLPARAFAAFLRMQAKAGEISLDGGWVRLAGHTVEMTQRDEELWRPIRGLIDGKVRFQPPRVRDIARALDVEETAVRRAMQYAARKGLIFEIAHDHYFTRAVVAEIADLICELVGSAPNGSAFPVAELRDRLDIGRKVAVHILEFFDRHGATARHGALRRVNVGRLALFRTPMDEPNSVSSERKRSAPGGASGLQIRERP
jgi:selenocysteine-specific elongation factor